MSEERNGMPSKGKDSKSTPGWAIILMAVVGFLLVFVPSLIYICDHGTQEYYSLLKELKPWVLISGLAAAPSLMLTWYWRKKHKLEDIENEREGQITERFIRAIELLGSDKMEVHLGAIYALERISKDSPQKDHWTIVETLAAFIRENAPLPPKEAEDAQEEGKKPANDVQAALAVLGRRKWREDEPSLINLSYTDLRGANLTRAHLEKADLSYAHLEEASLFGAHLAGAFLFRAHLERANLIDAHLEVVLFIPKDNLIGAIYSRDTTFPKGFDPEARGMILAEENEEDEKE